MKIDILTLFPDMFEGPFGASIIKRAQEKRLVEINVHQLRTWAKDKHKMTDDRPFGGGPGMVLMPEPLFEAVEDLMPKQQDGDNRAKVVLLTPTGKPFSQKLAESLSKEEHLIMICGRYEGVDQRVMDTLVDLEISIGDYVLSGGELPAMVVSDALIRLIPGVLGSEDSLEWESFNNSLLDYPHYTQPADFRGMKVPEVLISGNHAKIDKWRKEQAEKLTQERRPDLWHKYLLRKDGE